MFRKGYFKNKLSLHVLHVCATVWHVELREWLWKHKYVFTIDGRRQQKRLPGTQGLQRVHTSCYGSVCHH